MHFSSCVMHYFMNFLCVYDKFYGVRSGSTLYSAGGSGCYWSSSLNESNPFDALSLNFFNLKVYINPGSRCCGQSVRPVCPQN